MNRRELLKLLLLASGATVVGEWPVTGMRLTPHPAQIELFNRIPISALYGIPYHQSNASMSEWLGIIREYQK